MDPPSQSSIEALHTIRLYIYIYIYIYGPPSHIKHRGLCITYTLYIYRRQMDPPVNRAQRPCIPLHALLDLVQCI